MNPSLLGEPKNFWITLTWRNASFDRIGDDIVGISAITAFVHCDRRGLPLASHLLIIAEKYREEKQYQEVVITSFIEISQDDLDQYPEKDSST